ncbi:hypothetical protein [Lelliottia nimipressuralis]|uniref:hypothetical protein n=1 Tax=Lelliottia nimipressuralis TaxID=69220 RepID=UPI00289A9C81|nr:hypothetical protein [Lelliottia nimipressuralis]
MFKRKNLNDLTLKQQAQQPNIKIFITYEGLKKPYGPVYVGNLEGVEVFVFLRHIKTERDTAYDEIIKKSFSLFLRVPDVSYV